MLDRNEKCKDITSIDIVVIVCLCYYSVNIS